MTRKSSLCWLFCKCAVLALIAMIWTLSSAGLVAAACGKDVDYPEVTVDINAHYGCASIYNNNTGLYVCSRTAVNGCAGQFMTGPGDCVCTGSGDLCGLGIIGPPAPKTVEYTVYMNTNCILGPSGTNCECPNIFVGMSHQHVSDCFACPSGG
jgi:hypothetical protein